MKKTRLIAVVGSGGDISQAIAQQAERMGELVAARGWVLLTGGKGGVMEAASRGAAEAGGTVIGILPEAEASQVNPHVTIPIATGLGEARNVIIATACHGMIAVGGEHGTLSEIALARKLHRPLVLVSSPWAQLGELPTAPAPQQAIEMIAQQL